MAWFRLHCQAVLGRSRAVCCCVPRPRLQAAGYKLWPGSCCIVKLCLAAAGLCVALPHGLKCRPVAGFKLRPGSGCFVVLCLAAARLCVAVLAGRRCRLPVAGFKVRPGSGCSRLCLATAGLCVTLLHGLRCRLQVAGFKLRPGSGCSAKLFLAAAGLRVAVLHRQECSLHPAGCRILAAAWFRLCCNAVLGRSRPVCCPASWPEVQDAGCRVQAAGCWSRLQAVGIAQVACEA